MGRIGLSKGKLLSWLQCHKRLWLEVHRPDLEEISPEAARRFDAGYYVGDVARRLQPGGVLIENIEDIPKALADTRAHVEAGTPLLYEAAFEHDGVLMRADIVSLRGGRAHINEVKSATQVKDYYLSDAAIQAWVVERSGLKLDAISIQHINNQFVYPGGEEYEGLFATVPVDTEIKPLTKEVPRWVAAARSTLAGAEPRIEGGKQCDDPYTCPFQEYCLYHRQRDASEAKAAGIYARTSIPRLSDPDRNTDYDHARCLDGAWKRAGVGRRHVDWNPDRGYARIADMVDGDGAVHSRRTLDAIGGTRLCAAFCFPGVRARIAPGLCMSFANNGTWRSWVCSPRSMKPRTV